MPVRVNARLDEELWQKVSRIQRQTGQSVTEIIRASIDHYYRRIMQEHPAGDVLQRSGFVGCAEGPSDLSSTYKEGLSRSLGRKT